MKAAAAIAIVLAIAAQAHAQGVSVIVSPVQQAEQLPAPPAPPEQLPAPEQIPTPMPSTSVTVQPAQPPTPWVIQRHYEAVPVYRWGFFGKRLVPRVLVRPVYTTRPAQVVGPFYYYR